MSLATYSDILTAITNFTHRSDLSTIAPDLITLAESRINKELRVKDMETSVASTIAAGVISVPSGYLAMKNAYISSVSPIQGLDRKDSNWIYSEYPNRNPEDIPKFIAREESSFIFGPYPNANYVVTLVYWARLPALSSATNPIFTAYPGLWLFGALAEAAPYIKDDKRIGMWEGKFNQILKMVQDENDDEYHSGSVMAVSVIDYQVK